MKKTILALFVVAMGSNAFADLNPIDSHAIAVEAIKVMQSRSIAQIEDFKFENKGSSSATEILQNYKIDLNVRLEGDSAKAMYLKIKVAAQCEGEDATSGLCVKTSQNITCSEQTNSRGAFYTCDFSMNSQGHILPGNR